MGHGRTRNKKKNQSGFLFPQSCRMRCHYSEKVCEEIGFHGEKQEFSFACIRCEVFEKHLRGVVKEVIWINEKGVQRGAPS